MKFGFFNRKIKKAREELKGFYENKIKETENAGNQDKKDSFISDRVSNFKNPALIESFHTKNLKAEDFMYFKNSVVQNLQMNETFSVFLGIFLYLIEIIESFLILIKIEKKSLLNNLEKNSKLSNFEKRSILKENPKNDHRRNKSELPAGRNSSSKKKQDKLITIRSMSDVSDMIDIEDNEPEKRQLIKDDTNINYLTRPYQRINDRIQKKMKKREGLNEILENEAQKNGDGINNLGINRGKNSCEPFCLVF